MKTSRSSEQQNAFVLRQADDGTSVAEVCRKTGISEATYYVWRKKFGGLMQSEMKRLKQLDGEIGPPSRDRGALLACISRSPQKRTEMERRRQLGS